MIWTEQDKMRLRKLHSEGKSTQFMTIVFNKSRSSILSKLKYLGLKGTGTIEPKTSKPKEPKPAPEKPRPKVKGEVLFHSSFNTPNENSKHLALAGKGDCVWPVSMEENLYCGNPVNVIGSPYCAEHHALAYQKSTRKPKEEPFTVYRKQ